MTDVLFELFSRPSQIHGCRIASSGVDRFTGSHVNHFSRKSRNCESFTCIALDRLFDEGCRTRPRVFGATKGFPIPSKNKFFLVACFSKVGGGAPRISIIQSIQSFSLSPGKRGRPVASSARMQPNDQMSIAIVQVIPNMISGAR